MPRETLWLIVSVLWLALLIGAVSLALYAF
jgi:hypothetical protein